MKKSMGIIEVDGKKLEVAVSKVPLSLSELMRSSNILLNFSCGGKGVCGKCVVYLIKGDFKYKGEVIRQHPGNPPQKVLACQTELLCSDFHITIPKTSIIEPTDKILDKVFLETLKDYNPTMKKISFENVCPEFPGCKSKFERIAEFAKQELDINLTSANETALKKLSEINSGKIDLILSWVDNKWELTEIGRYKKIFGLAIDIGTTTVVASLVDIEGRKIVETASAYNQQIRLGEDVATRISIGSDSEGLETLRKLIIEETINPLIDVLVGNYSIDRTDIVRVVISGNTTMWHIVLGLNPSSLGAIPFEPTVRAPEIVRAKEVGINILPDGLVDIVPSISAYVGGDLVSDIEVCDFWNAEGVSLLIDIGTNGEMVLKTDGKVYATACAAGPAFEGVGIRSGVRAQRGAIERIRFTEDGGCEFEIIGNGEVRPIGICGSALIDFIAEGFKVGIINSAGRLDVNKFSSINKIRKNEEGIWEYVIVEGNGEEKISITEKDIESVLKAKAAIQSAIKVLLRKANLVEDDIDRVFLAGGFARYIDIENAKSMGLLPNITRDKYQIIGNGSLGGAIHGLLDLTSWYRFKKSINIPEIVELNLEEDFEEKYTLSLFIPYAE